MFVIYIIYIIAITSGKNEHTKIIILTLSKNIKNKTKQIQEGMKMLYAHKVSLKYSLSLIIGNFLQYVNLPLQSNHITKSLQ